MSETGHTHASAQFPTVCNEENEKLSERSFCTTQTLKIKRFLMTFFLAIHDTFKDDVSLHQFWAWCFWGLVTVQRIQRNEGIIIVTYMIISICFQDGIIKRTRTDGLMIGDTVKQVTTYTINTDRLRETTCPFFGRISNFRASNYHSIILILIGWDV